MIVFGAIFPGGTSEMYLMPCFCKGKHLILNSYIRRKLRFQYHQDLHLNLHFHLRLKTSAIRLPRLNREKFRTALMSDTPGCLLVFITNPDIFYCIVICKCFAGRCMFLLFQQHHHQQVQDKERVFRKPGIQIFYP